MRSTRCCSPTPPSPRRSPSRSPPRILGEEVAAAIVLREGSTATTADIQAFAAERLAKFKVPVRLEFLDEIPKGPTGKLQRIGLAQKLGLA